MIERAPGLPAGLVHGFSDRLGGVSEGRYATLNLGRRWGDAPAAVAELARLIYPKTLGNPFFIEQFLENASERGLLVLDAGRGCWGWDADGLAAAMSTDNVVELMLARLRRLPGAVLRLLQVAACVGHRFELRRVAQAQGEPLLAAARGLAAGLASGLIVPLGGGHHLIHEGLGEAEWVAEEARKEGFKPERADME